MSFPRSDHARRLHQVQFGSLLSIEACHEHAQAKRSSTAGLGVLLDDLRYISRHELDRWRVFVVESVALSFKPRVVHQDSAV